jgi:hypothetical protein
MLSFHRYADGCYESTIPFNRFTITRIAGYEVHDNLYGEVAFVRTLAEAKSVAETYLADNPS